VEIKKELLKNLLDIATSSMDFGSGFMEDSDVFSLRQVAELLGLDPNRFTPENYYDKYQVPLSALELQKLQEYKKTLAAMEPIVPAALSPDHEPMYPAGLAYYKGMIEKLEKRARSNSQEVE
jgi:hypothetical protein